MNALINAALASPIARVLGFVLVVSLIVVLTSQVQSCRYDRSREQYRKERETWTVERTRLLAEAEAKERRIQELEPQLAAYKAAAEEGKRIDDGLAQKIEETAQALAEASARAETPVDCRVRARRLCDMFRASSSGFDCRALFGQCERTAR